ncbi:MAG: tellurite resistance TerB family protein [Synergistaceae bacterium]|nr:tellurite resistance TerB family protein [Synergistaceae bacterium]MBR0069764.1 tellurite resistance TerB family protein [Synergistaceae bacterium]
MDFMSLLGSMIQSTTASSPAASQRVSNAGGGIQDLLGSLMGAGQSVKDRVGGDNLAAGGIGALLGALMGGSRSTTMNSLGGGMMGLLGMMAYKALRNSMGGSSSSNANANAQAYVPPAPQQQASDAEIILLAMIDAAKADGQIDADEFRKITDSLKNSGVGQEGVNYVLQKLQGPMETAKIVSATRGRPDLAAQVYSASLMAIEVDTDAERMYLDKLAKAMGLDSQVIQNIEQLTGSNSKEYMC